MGGGGGGNSLLELTLPMFLLPLGITNGSTGLEMVPFCKRILFHNVLRISHVILMSFAQKWVRNIYILTVYLMEPWMTNSLSCEREDNMIINKFPQKLNANVLSWTLQNMCSYALGNIYKHHFNKQKVTFDTLHPQHLVMLKPTPWFLHVCQKELER